MDTALVLMDCQSSPLILRENLNQIIILLCWNFQYNYSMWSNIPLTWNTWPRYLGSLLEACAPASNNAELRDQS